VGRSLIDLAEVSDQELLRGIRTLTSADARYWFYITMMVGVAKVTEGLLNRFLSSRAGQGGPTSGMLLRGFPSKTLQAQQDLAIIAKRISATTWVRDLVLRCPVNELLTALEGDPTGGATLADIHAYLETYGHQVYNLDFVEPTQAEDPIPVLLSLQALVRDAGSLKTWEARQAVMAQERESLERTVLASLGPARRWLFRKLLAWAQQYGPCREQALFYMGAAWPQLRRIASELGQRLVGAGTFTSPDDVYYLGTQELEDAFAAREEHAARSDLGERASARRVLRERRKRLHPPGRIPQDLRFNLVRWISPVYSRCGKPKSTMPATPKSCVASPSAPEK
jgi:pyruvate,water dikinase